MHDPIAAQATSPVVQNFKLEARAAAARNQWDQAVASYQKAIELQPHDASLCVELGAALTKSGRLTDAIASYNAALKIAPQNLPAELGLAAAYRAVHNYDETRRTLDRAHREHPNKAAPLAALGDLEIELQTYDAAIGHLKAAIELDPFDTKTRNFLAAAYKAKGDQENALAQLAKVLARDPDNALAYFLRAQIYSDRNEDARALPDAEKALALQPQNPSARIIVTKILVRAPENAPAAEITTRCTRAVAVLEPLLATKSSDSETLFLLSRAYRCAGQESQAQKTLAAFETASQNDRSTKQQQLEAKHLVDQAEERAMKNDFPAALDLLQLSIAKDPAFSPAYSLLAKLNYSTGNLEKAHEAITQALALSPNVPDFLYVQGKIFEKEGKLDDALAVFQRTVLVNPRESDAYFEMGVIYQQRNDRPRALAAYKKAAELSPDDPDYRRAVAALSSTPAKP
ncbi:MAG TPA: tetratricopeptide repeat protein [Candidatus Limnocylindria bacterium]|nr:tetratricopeptide repeat protein [Candidatus Limnocylindria bacterium]